MDLNEQLNGKLIIALGRNYKNAHRSSCEFFHKHGITLAQFMVLELLYNRGEQTVQTIIDKVLSSSGSMTVVIRNLESKKLITRRKNPDDRRSYLIGITPEGKQLMDEVFYVHMENISDVFSKLTAEEKTTVVEILKKLK